MMCVYNTSDEGNEMSKTSDDAAPPVVVSMYQISSVYDEELRERQEAYNQAILASNVITPDMMGKFVLLFGMRVWGAYDTEAEMVAATNKCPNLHFTMYHPKK